MSELLRARLSRTDIGDHPDANLLSAFAENALTAREREQVLSHLGACSECRESFAIAFGADALPAPANQAKPVRRLWLWTPIAAAAAATCLIALLWRPKAPEPSSYAALQPAPAPAAAAPAPMQHEPPPPRQARLPEARPRVRAFKAPTKDVMPQAKVGDAAVPPPPTAPAPAGISTADANAVAKQQADAVLAQPLPPPPPQTMKSGFTAQEESRVPVVTAHKSRRPMLATSAMTPAAASPPALIRWGVNSDGALQRSFDGGTTWTTVPVDDRVTFRAVANWGGAVWAGGDGGALYRSDNNGATWTQLHVAGLNGAITAISLAGTSTVTLTTGAGERWITRDNGATWQQR